MLIAPFSVTVPWTKFEEHDEVVVLVNRKASDTVDVVGTVHDVLDRSDRASGGVEPHLSAAPPAPYAASADFRSDIAGARPWQADERNINQWTPNVSAAVRDGQQRRVCGDGDAPRASTRQPLLPVVRSESDQRL
jgi:hypothetical protein